MRLLWLPDVLRDAGLNVVVEDGWETRGSSSFAPTGMIWHHTAGPHKGNFPTLPILIHGRRDLKGPLAQIGGARDGTVHVIASGRANHAGEGGWRGLSGNTSVIGWEPEHPGDSTPWGAQLESMRVGTAAIFKFKGWDHRLLCGHKEWTDRKIDPTGVEMTVERARLEVALRRKPSEEDDMPGLKLIRIAGGDVVYACNGTELLTIRSAAVADAMWPDWRSRVEDVPANSVLAKLPKR